MKIDIDQLRGIIAACNTSLWMNEQLATAPSAPSFTGRAAVSAEQESAKKMTEFRQDAVGQLQTILNNFQSAEEIAAFMKDVEAAGIKIVGHREEVAAPAPTGAPAV